MTETTPLTDFHRAVGCYVGVACTVNTVVVPAALVLLPVVTPSVLINRSRRGYRPGGDKDRLVFREKKAVSNNVRFVDSMQCISWMIIASFGLVS
jgi:hypothetical protein